MQYSFLYNTLSFPFHSEPIVLFKWLSSCEQHKFAMHGLQHVCSTPHLKQDRKWWRQLSIKMHPYHQAKNQILLLFNILIGSIWLLLEPHLRYLPHMDICKLNGFFLTWYEFIWSLCQCYYSMRHPNHRHIHIELNTNFISMHVFYTLFLHTLLISSIHTNVPDFISIN